MPPSTRSAKRKTPDPGLRRLQSLYDAGRYGDVLNLVPAAIAAHPDRADLYALAASAAARSGMPDHAVTLYRQAIAVDGPASPFTAHLGRLLLDIDRPPDALNAFKSRIAAVPEDATAWYGAGQALLAMSCFPEAVTSLSESIRLAPSEGRSYFALGQTYEQMGLAADALTCFALALQLGPACPEYAAARARALHATGDMREALAALRAADRQWPGSAVLLDTKGNILASAGAFEEAKTAYRAAIQAQPANPVPYANFVRHADMTKEPEIADAVAGLLDRTQAPRDRRWLLYARTKILEDRQDYGAAYAALEQANALQRKLLGYDPEDDIRMFAALKSMFAGVETPAMSQPAPGPHPVFIVGLPRSGTTLVEMILSRHSEVQACGESDALMHAIRHTGLANRTPRTDDREALRNGYLSGLPEPAQRAKWLTDKMPLNFRLVGHIATGLPDARIVHVRRDHRATCWSLYRTYFSGSGNGFSYDPADIQRYYALYRDLMQFWYDRFPNRIVTVDYEKLVKDQSGETRNLLSGMGLDWQDSCLSPEAAGLAVRTASAGQVRQKVYQGSSEGWKHYRDWAGPWLDQVGDAGRAP